MKDLIFLAKTDAILLHLFPYLLPATKGVLKKIKYRKTQNITEKIVQVTCSKQEFRDSFFIHIEVYFIIS